MRSREQQLWGQYVGKLTYRGTGDAPSVTVRPPRPIAAPPPADCLNFWVYGNNIFGRDPTTPPVELSVVLRSPGVETVRIGLGTIRWKEWWVMHCKLSAAQLESLQPGSTLEALEITGGRNAEDRVLYFDNLAFYKEELPPLSFLPRPKRGVTQLAGQDQGLNTRPGILPFPTR